jgi:mannonate dehydratase
METIFPNKIQDLGEAMKMMAMGSTVGLFGMFGGGKLQARDNERPSYAKGMAHVKITNVKAIATCPEGINHIVV